VIVDNWKITGVVDWCEACIGDAAFDVAWSNLILFSGGFERLSEPFVEAYKRHSGRELKNLLFYEVTAGLRQFCDLLRLKETGALSLEKRPDAAVLYDFDKELAKTESFIRRRTGIDLSSFLR
jgi:aminoglycoside phosphotransferase (APT) family kinase protein